MFNFTANKDEDVGLEYQQTQHLFKTRARRLIHCLFKQRYPWKRGKGISQEKRKRDMPGKEKKRNRGKEMSLEKRKSFTSFRWFAFIHR